MVRLVVEKVKHKAGKSPVPYDAPSVRVLQDVCQVTVGQGLGPIANDFVEEFSVIRQFGKFRKQNLV
jgi:hypothetical protein